MNLRDMDPTFDQDGHPTEETRAALSALDGVADPWEATDAACDFMARAWRWGESCCRRRPDGIWVFATGGWSGNEQLIRAFQRSLLYRYWVRWRSVELSGGLHVIPYTPAGGGLVDVVERVLCEWAWGQIRTESLMALLDRREGVEP